MRGLIVLRMTRARTASYGVVTPPPLDRWIDAVLMLFASLVQGVVATFGMRRWIGQRDWHAQSGSSALPQTKPDIHLKEDTIPTESLSALCRESLLEHPKGLTNDPVETRNQDSRDKPENDPVDAEALEAGKARVPGGGRDPASAQSALPTRTIPSTVIPAEARQRVELKPRSYAHLPVPPLPSGSRLRASGMTNCVCPTTA